MVRRLLFRLVRLSKAGRGTGTGVYSPFAKQSLFLLRSRRRHEREKAAASRAHLVAEPRQNRLRILPGKLDVSHQGAVAAPRIHDQPGEIAYEPGTNRVEMNVSNQSEEIRLVIHHLGSVSIFEEMTHPLIPLVEANRIAGQEALHDSREPLGTGPDRQVDVIGHQTPGVDERRVPLANDFETIEEVLSIPV